jgi:hypothetical protein
VKPVTIPTLPHTVYHRSPSREDKTRPVPHNLGDSALSIRSRPGLDPTSTLGIVQRQGKDSMARRSGSFHRLVSHDAMVSRDGRPFPGHVATVNSTGIDQTSPPVVLASSRPIKGQARVLRRKREKTKHPTTQQQTTKKKQEIDTSSNHPCPFSLSLRLGLDALSRLLVTPTRALRCKEIQTSSHHWT